MVKKSNSNKEKESISNVINVEGLIEQATIAYSNMNFELAIKFYERALTISSKDTQLMDALADTCLQIGDTKKAYALLLDSVKIEPNLNPYKWLYLAQLQEGKESLNSYNNGIEKLLLSLNNNNSDNNDIIIKQISKAYSSIAELYLTDLCYEDNAEKECENNLLLSLKYDNNSLDGLQTMASFRLSQKNGQEACKLMDIVYENVRKIRDKLNSRTVFDEIKYINNTDNDFDDEFSNLPEIEFCISTAKLLIECANYDNKYAEKAIELCTDLLQYNDDNIELWYITGVAGITLVPPDIDVSKYHLYKALEMMNEIIEKNGINNFIYNEQYELVNEHVKILNELENNNSINNNDDNNNEMINIINEDNNWSDDDDHDDMDEDV